ncbi:hypothetical protein KUTeg_014534 [Tegillarca granosa]|uniref:LolA-like domain-containing protein n=1 Tax=Tegillarca granosa TaxID=220873 RepID=A0ABQ9EWC6_TEGGR|nr:hypothetical protein KUTeg_014534 [Tegillarca granosa]
MAAIIRSVLVCIVVISLHHVSSQTAKHGADTSVCDPTQIQASSCHCNIRFGNQEHELSENKLPKFTTFWQIAKSNPPFLFRDNIKQTKAKPTLPNSYQVKIECNFKDKNMTTDISEYYDQLGNRAAVKKCYTQSISGTSNTILFGYKPNTGNTNSGRIFSANGALHFGNGTKEQYMGTAVVLPSWDTAVGRQSIPIRCVVSGNIWENGKPRAFNHTYDLAEFRSQTPSDDKFETPSGIVCPHRKLSKALPVPGPHFTFTAETLDLNNKKIGFIKEYYDFNTSLFRYDYKPQSPTQYGTDLLTEVHDYSEGDLQNWSNYISNSTKCSFYSKIKDGLAYIIDPMIGNCSVNYIDGSGLDARFADANGNARLRTPKEFFDFDKYTYEYEGVKTVRGIKCDVWITQRNDWPVGNPQNSTWEWWFALPNSWTQSLLSVVYNIYDYNEEEPAIWKFDISKCYNSTEKQDIHFKLPEKRNVVSKEYGFFMCLYFDCFLEWTDQRIY